MAETMYRPAVKTRIFLRPKRSLTMPANAAPTMQPMSRHPTAQPACKLSSWKWAFTNSIAPAMIAVSKPKSSPPTAAMAETTKT